MQTYLLKTGVATLLCLLASFTGATPAQAQKKKKAAPAAEWYRTFQAEGVVKSNRLLSFEPPTPPDFIYAEDEIKLSSKHFRDGRQSLHWSYQPGNALCIRRDLGFEAIDPAGKDLYQSAFIVWIYNEEARNEQITFQFLKDGRVCTSFPMNINFTGWRGAWLLYERDMQGKPEEGMNEIRITTPEGGKPGSLYFDHLITAAKIDPRQQTADEQLPFVNKGNDNHWLVVYEHSLWKPEISLTPVTGQHKQEFALLEKRFTDLIYTPGKLTEKEMSDIRQRYSYYDIKRTGDGGITGRPVYFVRHSEAYERLLPEWDKDLFTTLDVEFTAYFNLMKRIAVAYRNAETELHKEELKTMFLAMYDNITDQGVAYGSCWGNAHHYGYSMRGLFVSYFLMKDVLLASGQLDEAERTLRWYAITNEVYPKPTVNGIDIDTFNTKLQGRVASILIMEDTPEKLQYMRSLQRWLEYGCRPAPGLMGSFKADGACFHHCNNYPAYAVGGLDNATQMIYLLSGTEFKLSELAHRTVKNVLLAMRFYCNLKQWPLSMSGRHPNGGGELIPMHYATMALAGTPDGKQKVDAEMAEAFLRLVQYDGLADKESPEYMPKPSSKQNIAMRSRLQSLGFGAETDPQGNLALGYGCVSAQRRDNWAAVVRGHSRYLWAAEHYLPANFYGRYLAHGSMQILTAPQGREVTFGTSGWQEAGFDWNRIPGATAIHLPFDLLRARVLNVDVHSGMEEMLYSDEAFAGGLSHFHRNGNFGMKLHEHDKYNGSLRARKSYHFFDGTIVCLGSDIENLNADYPTETTLFQVCASQDTRGYWDAYRPDADSRTFIDPNGTGFYLSQASARDARFERNFPQVTVGERSTKPTQGDWVNLTLLHGKAPKGAGYEYAVLPKTDTQALKAFARKPNYKVWQRDRQAHIVRSTREDLTSYVLFETPQSLPPEGWLQKADTACLVMIGQESDRLYLTVAQPDLALYRGASDDVYDKDGKRIERSIYSRPWIANESGTIPVTVTLKGCWKPLPASPVRVLESSRKRTVLQFECREGASYDVMLEKQ